MNKVLKTGLIWSGLGLAVSAVLLVYAYFNLPRTGEIPVHWNLSGEADRYLPFAGAMRVLVLAAIIGFGVNVLLVVLSKLEPRQDNLERSAKPFLTTWAGVNIFFVFILGLMVFSMTAEAGEFSPELTVRFVLAGVSILMAVLGNYMPKTRPNWMIGVRTRWTLSSNFTWERTHRLGGWLFMSTGLIGFLCALFAPAPFPMAAIVPLVLADAMFLLAYSYIVWRAAPDREPAG